PGTAVLASHISFGLALRNGLAFVVPVDPRAAAVRDIAKQRSSRGPEAFLDIAIRPLTSFDALEEIGPVQWMWIGDAFHFGCFKIRSLFGCDAVETAVHIQGSSSAVERNPIRSA